MIVLPPALILYIAGHVIHATRKKQKSELLIDRAESVIRSHQLAK